MTASTVEIPLTQGFVAIVDAKDHHAIARYRWRVVTKKSRYSLRHYALRQEWSNGSATTVYMHRQILDSPAGVLVDHEDGDGLNNRRSNLRLATFAKNAMNQRKSRGRPTSSKYKGVFLDSAYGLWHARLTVNGKQKHIGYFREECDAATAYNFAAQEAFGSFASLNITS